MMNNNQKTYDNNQSMDINSDFEKINPDFYIHTAYIKIINSLDSENIQMALTRLTIGVNMLEILARSDNKISTEETTELNSIEAKTPEELAIKKLGILSKAIFSSKPMRNSLSDNK